MWNAKSEQKNCLGELTDNAEAITMESNAPAFDIVSFYPENFKSKSVNEPFIQKIMASVLPDGEWIPGDASKSEPDYFCNGTPFEFTLASNSKKKGNFIQRYFGGTFSSEDVEQDVCSYIYERIKDKASKHYSVEGVHLCVLCLLDLSRWVSDYYGSFAHDIVDWQRQEFFIKLRDEFIKTGLFANIFIIFPDPCVTWWVYDVLSEGRANRSLTDAEIKSGIIPFHMFKNYYEQFFPSEEGEP